MALDQETSAYSASCRTLDSAKNGRFRAVAASRRTLAYPPEVTGFLLSRETMGCSKPTVEWYRNHLTFLLRFVPVPIQEIERSDIDRYLIDLRDRGCSPHYINSAFRACRAFFNWCVQEELRARSPMRTMKTPRLPKLKKGFVDEQVRDRLLAVCPTTTFLGARNAAMVWLYWSTGARRNEIAYLALEQIDWQRNCIRVFGKGARERFIPFTPEAKKAVWRYLKFRHDEHAHLWITEERRPAQPWGLASAMRRLIERAGLDGEVKDCFHVFRRSWAMRNIRAGRSIKDIQLIGGWESITVLEGYVRAMESEDAIAGKWV